MKTVKIDMGLCERLVDHAELLDGRVERRFLDLIKALFKKNDGDIIFKRKAKEMNMDESLSTALKNMDKAVLDVICKSPTPWLFTNMWVPIYRDFTTLRTIIS